VTEPTYQLSVHEQGRLAVARIGGEIDQSNVAQISEALRQAGSKGPLIVDLTAVQYLDSAGVAMLDDVRKQTDLTLVAPIRSIPRRVLEITALDQIVPTLASLDQCPE
jgi:anti-anti-sigma factor